MEQFKSKARYAVMCSVGCRISICQCFLWSRVGARGDNNVATTPLTRLNIGWLDKLTLANRVTHTHTHYTSRAKFRPQSQRFAGLVGKDDYRDGEEEKEIVIIIKSNNNKLDSSSQQLKHIKYKNNKINNKTRRGTYQKKTYQNKKKMKTKAHKNQKTFTKTPCFSCCCCCCCYDVFFREFVLGHPKSSYLSL